MASDAPITQPVFISLTTSEPGGEGQIVRVEASREIDGSLQTLERLVRAPRLTLAQSRMTGVTNSDLDNAPELDEVLQALLDFCEGADAWVVEEGASARVALRTAGRACGYPGFPKAQIIALDELAAIVEPHRRGGVEEGETLRARFEHLLSALLRLPLPVLSEMNWLISRSDHPLKKLLRAAEAHAVKHQFSETLDTGRVALEKLFKDYSEIIDRLTPAGEKEESDPDEPPPLPPPPSRPITAEEVDALLGASGPLAKALDGYEDRPEQLAMARRVAEALSKGQHLMVEAGTGVGKSLAYLVPAALFAQRAGRPVIVSTHTKNLQSQLYHKDLPFLQKNAGTEFTTALLKGRPNYLCLRKFMYTLHEAAHELDDEERARMLPLITWATQTETGDVSEMEVFSREQDGNLWSRLHTVGEDCLKRQCPFYKRCFVYKARGTARTADIVVANHSLVFAEIQIEAGTLPPYSEIVFDEGHKLEDVATEHLACEVTPRRIYTILNKLYRTAPGATAGKGLLPALLMHVDNCRAQFSDSVYTSIRDHILNCMQATQPAVEGGDFFFHTMRSWTDTPVTDDDAPIESYVPRERGRPPIGTVPSRMPEPFSDEPSARPQFPRKPRRNQGSDERKRFSSSTLRPDETERLTNGKEAAIATLGRLRQALEKLEEDFAEIRKRAVPRARELIKEIQAQNLFIAEIIHDIEFVIRGEEPNYVYWSERLGRRAARVVAAPLDVAKLLYDQLYEKKRSIIIASATLSVRDIDAGDGSGLTPWRPPPVQIRDSSLEPPPGYEDDEPSAEPAGRVAEKPHPKSFEFLKNRLGLSLCTPQKLSELLLGSPFNYDEQCRLLVPTFLPEPGYREREFNTAFTQMVADLVLLSRGRAMVLYTSYTALESSAQVLRPLLAPEGIEVLAQGADGSRESLLERLKTGDRTVLLGTASFWEGVDVRGEALSLLIIAKLPFAVFTDPIVQGRCELLEASGKDAFLHFSVPNAILRLRQGFGRLIRSKTDRGIVVLADKRVLTKRYGAAFLRALPAKARTITSQDQLQRVTKEFLDERGETSRR
ncbi:MAG TPA: helicase C-terminal domain-containing protein [Planctomycetota bacterium]|nr:helicase C-terminal domain-containing protein [Planctomycetota bacterium]